MADSTLIDAKTAARDQYYVVPATGWRPGRFALEHRDKTRNDASHANDHMCGDDGQEYRGAGWNRDPKDHDAVVCYDGRRLTWKVTGAPRRR